MFGSYVKGKQTDNSDIDILVEFEKPITLIQFLKLENYFSQLLGLKVDLVMKKSLKSHIKKQVLKEAILLWQDIIRTMKLFGWLLRKVFHFS